MQKKVLVAQILIFSSLGLLLMTCGTAVVVKGEATTYSLEADDLLDTIDASVDVNITLLPSLAEKDRAPLSLSLVDARVSLGTSLALRPILIQKALSEHIMLQPGMMNLQTYYHLLAAEKGKSRISSNANSISEATYKALATSTPNDSADFDGTCVAYDATFALEDIFDRDILVSMNSSDVINYGVMERDYREFEEELASNTTGTDFISSANYKKEQKYGVQVSGFENLEEAFTDTIISNIAANLSVVPSRVLILEYNVTSCNKTTYISENFATNLRNAINGYGVASRTYLFFGITLFSTKITLSTSAADVFQNAVGNVLNFSNLLVSKALPTVQNMLTSIPSTVDVVVNQAKPIVQAALNAPQEIIKNVETTVTNAATGVQSVVSGVQTFVGDMVTGVQNVVTDTVSGITTFVDDAVGTVNGVIGAIQTFVSSFVQYLPLILLGSLFIAVCAGGVYLYWNRETLGEIF